MVTRKFSTFISILLAIFFLKKGAIKEMYCVLYYLDSTLTTYAFMCLVVVTCYIVKLDEKIHESLDLHIISKTKYENKWAKRPATFFKKDRIILFGQSI